MASTADLMMRITARDATGPAMNSAARHAQKLDRQMAKLRTGMRVAGTAAVVAAGYFAVDSVKAYAAAETAQNKLQTAYGKFPKINDVTLQSLRDLNSELQRKTQFDDDDLAVMQSKLAAFNLTGKQLQTVTPLIADYAQVTGKDVVSAGGAFGKALLGNTRALKELGITGFKPTGKIAQDFADLTDRLNKKVGGASTAAATTAAVKLAILRNQYGELKETVGAALLPVLTELTDAMVRNMPAIEAAVKRNMPAIKDAFTTVADVVKGAAKFVGGAYKTFSELPPGVKDAAITITGLATALGLLAGSAPGKGIKLAIDVLGGGFKALKSMVVTAAVVNVNGPVAGGGGGLGGGKGGGGAGGKAGKFLPWLLGGGTAGGSLLGSAAGPALAGGIMAGGFALGNAFYNSGGRKNNLVASGVTGQLMFQAPYPSKGPASRTPDGGLLNRARDAAGARAAMASLTAAQNGYNQSLANTRQLGAATNAGIRGNTTAALQNKAALQSQAQSSKALLGAYAATGVSAQQVAAKQAFLGRQFVRTAVGMGVPRAEAKRYARELGLLPSKKSTKVSAPGADEARKKLDATRTAAHRIPQQKMTRVRGENSDALAKIRNVERQQIPAKTVQILGNNSDAFTKLWDFLKAPAQKLVPILGSLFSASGGPVYGPGSSTSDSIPARLSNGEYVVKARSVRQYGLPFLNALNNGDLQARAMRFAKGGFTGLGAYNDDADADYKKQYAAWVKKNPYPKRKDGETNKQWNDRQGLYKYGRAVAQQTLVNRVLAKFQPKIDAAVQPFVDAAGGVFGSMREFANIGGLSDNIGNLQAARDAVVSAQTPTDRAAAQRNLDRVSKSVNPVEWLRDKLSALQTFRDRITSLRAKKVPPGLIAEVVAAGPENGTVLADAILAADLPKISELYGSVQTEAAGIGALGAAVSVPGDNTATNLLNSAISTAVQSGKAKTKIEIGFYLDGTAIDASLRRIKRARGGV